MWEYGTERNEIDTFVEPRPGEEAKESSGGPELQICSGN